MTEQPHVVPSLLHQLKVVLDMGPGATHTGRTGAPAAPAALLLQTDRRQSRPSHMRAEADHFERTLRQKTQNPRDYRMSLHLQKFSDEKIRQQKENEERRREQRVEEQNKLEDIRQRAMARVADNKQFLSDWNEKGLKAHHTAMLLRQQRDKADLSLELSFKQKAEITRQRNNSKAAYDVQSGIDVFEESLRRLTSTTAHEDKAAEEASLEASVATANMPTADFMRSLATKVPRDSQLQAEAVAYMEKVKDKRRADEIGRAERERRRRRVMVEQQRAQQEMEARRREDMLLSKLLKHSEEERRVAETLNETLAYKERMRLARLRREEQYAAQREKDFQLCMERDAEIYKAARENYYRGLEVEKQRHEEREAERREAVKQRHTAMASEIVDQIVDVTAKVAEYRELSDGMAMTPKEWRQLMVVFVRGVPLYPKEDKQSSQGEDVPVSAEDATLDVVAVDDFVCGLAEWNDGADLCGTAGGVNPVLGAALKDVETVLEPPADPPAPPQVPSFPITGCIVGPPLSGKSKQAALVAEKMHLKVIEPSTLVAAAVAKFKEEEQASASASGEEKNKEGGETQEGGEEGGEGEAGEGEEAVAKEPSLHERAAAAVSAGRDVDDEVVVGLIVQAINGLTPLDRETWAAYDPKDKKAKKPGDDEVCGWVLDGWPTTLRQAQLLETATSGYIDPPEIKPEDVPPPCLLAPRPPDPPPDPNAPPLPSGLLFCLRLEVEAEVTAQRALGKAVDPETGIVYHMEFDPPPAKDKALRGRLVINDAEGPEAVQRQEQLLFYTDAQPAFQAWIHKFGTLHPLDGARLFGEVHEDVATHVEARLTAAAEPEGEGEEQEGEAAEGEAAAPAPEEPTSDDAAPAEGGEVGGEEGEGQATEPGEGAEEEPVAAEEVGPELVPLHPDKATLLLEHWNHTEERFLNESRGCLRRVRVEHEAILRHLADARTGFTDFVTQPDDKQPVVDDFVAQFNAIDLELRSHEETKSELMLRIEELQFHLWDLSDASRHAAEVERQEIETSQWVPDHARMLAASLVELCQADVDRYQATSIILTDYYAAVVDQRNVREAPEPVDITTAAVTELQGKPPEDPKAKGKGAKKDDKGKGGAVEGVAAIAATQAAEAAAEGGVLTEDDGRIVGVMAGAIATAKDLLRLEAEVEQQEGMPKEYSDAMAIEQQALVARLTKIQKRFVEILNNFRLREKTMLNRMDELVGQRFKHEMDAIAGVTATLREATEQQTRINYRLHLNGPDFSMDLNEVLTPPPSPPPIVPREEMGPRRLNSHHLASLADHLASLAPSGTVRADDLAATLLRLAALAPGEVLPSEWVDVSPETMAKVIASLPTHRPDVVDWRRLWARLVQPKPVPLPLLLACRSRWEEAVASCVPSAAEPNVEPSGAESGEEIAEGTVEDGEHGDEGGVQAAGEEAGTSAEGQEGEQPAKEEQEQEQPVGEEEVPAAVDPAQEGGEEAAEGQEAMATPTVMADGTALLAALEGCAIWLDEMELAEPTIGPDSTPLHSDLIPSHANKAVFRAFATDGVVDVTSLLLHFTTTDPWMDGVDKAFALLAHDSRIGFAKFVKLVHMGGPSVDEEGHITSPELLATAFEEAVNLQRPPTTEEQGEDQAALAETVTLQTLRDCPSTARVLAACSPHYEHTLVYDLTFPPPPEEPQQEGEEGAEGGGEGDEPKPAEEGTTEA